MLKKIKLDEPTTYSIYLEDEPTIYSIYLEDGTEMEIYEKFDTYFKTNQTKVLYFSCFKITNMEEKKDKIELEEKEKKEKMELEEKKEQEETFILDLLRYNIKNPKKFKETVGDLGKIQLDQSLKISKFDLSRNDVDRLMKRIEALNDIQMRHEFQTESDRHFLVTAIISLAIGLIPNVDTHNEFYIKPELENMKSTEGIERRVDCVIYEYTLENVICLLQLKKNEEGLDECLRQNTDQMRAYCICRNKKIGRGICTNAEKWIFTEYTFIGHKLIVSTPYEILSQQPHNLKIYLIKNDNSMVEFFMILIQFIIDSLLKMKNEK